MLAGGTATGLPRAMRTGIVSPSVHAMSTSVQLKDELFPPSGNATATSPMYSDRPVVSPIAVVKQANSMFGPEGR